MEFRFARETQVPAHEAFAWMTDYTEDDHRGHRWRGRASRKVLSRTEKLVELEDVWRGRTLRMTVNLDPPKAWHARGHTRGAHWDTMFLIQALPTGGCRINERSVVEGEGIGKYLLPLLRGPLLRTFQEDLALHVADMEEQLGYAREA